jgi:Raf kinase inhibitor-like YbhB/YbcL family protein
MVDCVRGKNDFGDLEYDGPCPPSGTHRYFFKVYALNEILHLPEASKKDDLVSEIDECLIESAQLIGLYSKQKQVIG